MFHDETQPENHLEHSKPLPLQPGSPNPEIQRKRMLIALAILLVALAAVVLKDWDFWFPPDSETQEASARRIANRGTASAATSIPATPAREHKPLKPAVAAAAPEAPLTATTERAALPPLEIEVVAGNRHMAVPAKSSAIHLDVDSGATTSAPSAANSASGSAPAPALATTAGGDHVQLSPQIAQSVSISVPPDYPLLARQMKVQGAVSLQALISRDGSIQELEILSGPAILAAAAREAVKQWHFKPYLQNGQPVETRARITVNFTISTN
jgi:protein TonB